MHCISWKYIKYVVIEDTNYIRKGNTFEAYEHEYLQIPFELKGSPTLFNCL